jgi:hypothetical protein
MEPSPPLQIPLLPRAPGYHPGLEHWQKGGTLAPQVPLGGFILALGRDGQAEELEPEEIIGDLSCSP